MQIKDLSLSQLKELRYEVVLNSLFLKDYENSFGIDPKEVCDFFDGYVQYLFEIAEEKLHRDYDFYEVIENYDSTSNLLKYFMYFYNI